MAATFIFISKYFCSCSFWRHACMYASDLVTWHVCGGQRRDLGACLSLSPCEHQLRWAVASAHSAFSSTLLYKWRKNSKIAERKDSSCVSKAGSDTHIKQEMEGGDSKGLLRSRIMQTKRWDDKKFIVVNIYYWLCDLYILAWMLEKLPFLFIYWALLWKAVAVFLKNTNI